MATSASAGGRGGAAGRSRLKPLLQWGVNYLAHVYLARHDDDAMLGALLGDFVFGTSGPDVPVPTCLFNFIFGESSGYNIIAQFPAFSYDITEWINDHRASVFQLVIIHTDRV